MLKIVLALDLDDTLCNTQLEVVMRLRRALYDRAMWDDLKDVYKWSHIHALNRGWSTMNYPSHLREIIQTNIIRQGDYVKTVQPSDLITSGDLFDLFAMLTKYPVEVKRVVATHRYTENGADFNTHKWLDEYKVSPHLHDIHFIDGRIHSNKIDFLKALYPEHYVLLLDDNPFGKLHNGVYDANPHVVVYDKLAKYEAYANQRVFTDILDLVKLMLDITYKEKEVS